MNLSEYSNYNIGGPAKRFVEANTVDEIISAVNSANKAGLPVFILGGGTNILFSDNELNCFVIKLNNRQIALVDKCILRVGAGLLMPDLLDFAKKHGLSGLEWAGGLPGTLGGAIRGNAGAFEGEIKDIVVEVVSLDIFNLPAKIIKRSVNNCEFTYRNSIFKRVKGREIILEAKLKLEPGDLEKIFSSIQEKMEYRKNRHPIEYPNIGSIFKNVDYEKVPSQYRDEVSHVVKKDPFPVIPTAYLISEAGLKGIKKGGAQVSEKHPNFIINYNNARAEDVKGLIKIIKQVIREKYGIELDTEIEYTDYNLK